MILPLLALTGAALAGPEVVLSEEDEAAEEAGLEASGQADAALLAGLWEKGFLEGREDDKVVLGGYVESDFTKPFGGDSYFDQHRMVLFVYARVNDKLSFATEIEWEHGGSPRKDDGELVAGESLLEFCVADMEITPWLNGRAGIVLVPIGTYNLRHDAPTQDLATRPMAATYVAPSTWFEAGAGFFGQVPLGARQRLDYELYFINGLDSKLYDGLGTRAARGSLGEDNNGNKALVGRVSLRPLTSVEVGLSGYRGAYDPDSTRFVHMAALDVTARWRFLEAQGEAIATRIDPGFDEGWAQETRYPVPEGMWGFYGQVNAHFMPAPVARLMPDAFADATFTAMVRYGEVDTDTAVVSDGDRSRLMVGLNFRPVEAFVLKNELIADDNGGDGTLSRPWNAGWRPSLSYVASAAVLF